MRTVVGPKIASFNFYKKVSRFLPTVLVACSRAIKTAYDKTCSCSIDVFDAPLFSSSTVNQLTLARALVAFMVLSNFDIFRKVPKDLTSATRHGGILSLTVMSLIALVFMFETWTYLAGETHSKIVLDNSDEPKLEVHFEVSFYELPCRFASIEAWDFLGKSKLDVSANIDRTIITGDNGEILKGTYKHMPVDFSQDIHQVDDTIPDTGLVTEASTQTFATILKENEYTFVFYYVTVCFLFVSVLVACHSNTVIAPAFCCLSGADIARRPCLGGRN